jgi:hypothetical protein
LPLILGLSDQFNHAKVYTKIDLCGAYNLVHIQEGDEWKMMFKTRYDHFEYVVMPFGLTIVPFIFQHLINNVFFEYLDNFVLYYIDDILIFSKNMKDHECHVHLILEKLQEVGLYAKLEKCEVHQFEEEFLGYVISREGICMVLIRFRPLLIGLL